MSVTGKNMPNKNLKKLIQFLKVIDLKMYIKKNTDIIMTERLF